MIIGEKNVSFSEEYYSGTYKYIHEITKEKYKEHKTHFLCKVIVVINVYYCAHVHFTLQCTELNILEKET